MLMKQRLEKETIEAVFQQVVVVIWLQKKISHGK